LLYQGATETVM